MSKMNSASEFDTIVSSSTFMNFYLQSLIGVFHIFEQNINATFEFCLFKYNCGFHDNAGIYSESRFLKIFCNSFYYCNASRPNTSLDRGGTCICDLSSSSSLEHISTDYCSQSRSFGAIFFTNSIAKNINTSRQLKQTETDASWCSAHIFFRTSQLSHSNVYNCSGSTVSRSIYSSTLFNVCFASCTPNYALFFNQQTSVFKECSFIDISGKIVTQSNNFDKCIFDKIYSDGNIKGSTSVLGDVTIALTAECPRIKLLKETNGLSKIGFVLGIITVNLFFS